MLFAIERLQLFSPLKHCLHSIRKVMSGSVSFRRLLKTTGLVLTGLAFLGSIEFSTSAGMADGQTSYRTAAFSHHIAVTDDIFSEAEEERDIEARVAVFLLTAIIQLPEQIPCRGYLLPDPVKSLESHSKISAHPRGPPTI